MSAQINIESVRKIASISSEIFLDSLTVSNLIEISQINGRELSTFELILLVRNGQVITVVDVNPNVSSKEIMSRLATLIGSGLITHFRTVTFTDADFLTPTVWAAFVAFVGNFISLDMTTAAQIVKTDSIATGTEAPKRRGRPVGSKNKTSDDNSEDVAAAPKRRGRPVGSKNKPKEEDVVVSAASTTTPTRRPGRPRKNIVVDESTPTTKAIIQFPMVNA